VLYLADSAAAAIAEAFGRFPEWSEALMAGSPSLTGSVRAVARYRLSESQAVCNLDDPQRLVALRLRPSEVVTREYTRSQDWALKIYRQGHWAGVRWWSYYNPAWSSFGVWNTEGLVVDDISKLGLDDPDLKLAATTIMRRVVSTR
jgi:hypothetical protein